MAKLPAMSGRGRGDMYPGMSNREPRERVSSPFPNSKAEVIDRSGIDGRRIDKHGTPGGLDARFNKLPPGMNIEDQENANINPQPYLQFEGYGVDGVVRADHGAGAGYRVRGKV